MSLAPSFLTSLTQSHPIILTILLFSLLFIIILRLGNWKILRSWNGDSSSFVSGLTTGDLKDDDEEDLLDSDPTTMEDTPPTITIRNKNAASSSHQLAPDAIFSMQSEGHLAHVDNTRPETPPLHPFSTPHVNIKCHNSPLLSFCITPYYIVFVYDECNEIYLWEVGKKGAKKGKKSGGQKIGGGQKISIALERGGFASCATTVTLREDGEEGKGLPDNNEYVPHPKHHKSSSTEPKSTAHSSRDPTTSTPITFLFLCTDSIAEGYCVHKYQLLTQEERKRRKQQKSNSNVQFDSMNFHVDPNRELLHETREFSSWRHPALICQIECVRNKYLITRCEDHDTCFIMDAQSGDLLMKLCTGQLKTAMFACSSKYLVNASFMTLIKIYAFSDVVSQKKKHTSTKGGDLGLVHKFMDLSGHKSSVQYVCFSPDSTQLVSVSNDGTMRLWSLLPAAKDSHCLNQCELMQHMEGILPTKCSMLLAWSPHGKYIAFAFENQVVLIDAHSLEEKSRIVAHTHITILRWSENSKFIISGHLNGETNFWKNGLDESRKE
uniref:Guanine nucleotide-binding protein subunit beta-like protein n=1 Tax=Percolomonas cosmopolitus TaxID=63605 RepID=A0A7S1KRI8_9EUKA|mmetsp:Transcript_5617/g.21132  ORF Transcript_5617/g.21132 Transcript_5617/m.21132 type:complete len:550 (+) Transcript_5617:91-1740(+)